MNAAGGQGRQPSSGVVAFLRSEAAGGIVLVLAAVVAMVWANCFSVQFYEAILNLPVMFQIGSFSLAKPLLLWINDGLMAIFFLLVGLEIKREVFAGELATRDKIILPGAAALGGMVAPALIYAVINIGGDAMRGWAVPVATDIAFALGVAALLGDRMPQPLKILLMALAIVDDLGAIVIIALFYTANLSLVSLGFAGAGIVVLFVLNRAGVTRLGPYLLVGVYLWVCVLKSGVHATLAGVVLAFAIPIRADEENSPLHRLEHGLEDWVAYAILPVFAFANAGISLEELTPHALLGPLPVGVAFGLLLGKPIGVMLAGTAAVRWRMAVLPAGVSWRQYFGMALLTGIGFTMSLFIGTLAFDDILYQTELRIGVLVASLTSAIAGYLVLRAPPRGAA